MAEQDQLRLDQPRMFKERKDVLNYLSDAELMRFRLNRAGIIFVTDLVHENLTSRTARNQAITPEINVIVTTWVHPSSQ